jgi:cytochrome c peroxidase
MKMNFRKTFRFIGGALSIGAVEYYLFTSHYNLKIYSLQKGVNYNNLKADIEDILWNKNYEDKHVGPILVRLAWHSSGTYDKESRSGGSNGATMRHLNESKHGANKGLDVARNFLEPIKRKHPGITYSDLWIYSAYVAIEFMGGPHIDFVQGRKDVDNENLCPPDGRLPDASLDRRHIRDIFYRMGFNDQEIVALVGGGHALGRCHPKRSGYDGPWTNNPLGFGNLFFKELFEREWVEKKWEGPKQFVDKQTGKLMMLPTDLELRDDPEFKIWSLKYKDDPKLFEQDFAKAFKKLTELGFKQF